MQEERHNTRHLPLAEVGFGALRAALLFGSTAVAIALIATPMIERGARSYDTVVSLADEIDTTVTGTVPQTSGGRYTIRRSVLQSSPNAVCIIRDNGSRIGDC